jgi:hypothetical protein
MFLEERVETMKPRFSGFDDGPLPDSTPVASHRGESTVLLKRPRAHGGKRPAGKTTALVNAHTLSGD